MWLTRLSLRNPILILMVSLALVVLGATSLARLPVDLFPNISLPVLIVGTVYQGASPEDIEKTVTYQIEKAVTSVSNVDHVQSASKEGLSIVQVWLRWGSDIETGLVEVTQHIQQIINVLPVGVQQPFVIKFDVANLPVCDVTLSGGGLDERGLYDLAYNTIEPQLEQLPGVASATVNGGKIRQITVAVDRAKMRARDVSILDVVNAVGNSNLIQPSGWIRIGKRHYNIFSNSQFRVVPLIAEVVVRSRGGVPVRVADVGAVEDSAEEQTNIVRGGGHHAVYLAINKQPGANTVDVVDGVRQRLSRLVGVPPGVRLSLTFDQSVYIRQSIDNLEHEALQGAFLAFVVILLFIQSIAGTLIVSLAIPLSIMVTFLLLYASGQTINVFTLGGLALGVGRLVDDAIVMLENISRHVTAGERGPAAILAAAQEVSMPILASTITTIVVFLPVVFITGIAQLLFIPMALTISYALGASFFVSTTVTPALCEKYLEPERELSIYSDRFFERMAARAQRWIRGLDEGYQRWLTFALKREWRTVGAVVAIFVLSLGLVPFIGSEFFPASDESQFQVTIRAPVGSRIEHTEQIVAQIEDVIEREVPKGDLRMMLSNIGLLTTAGKVNTQAAVYSSNTGPHAAFIQADLVPPNRRKLSTAQIADRLRPVLAREFPGLRIYLSPGGIIRNVLNFGSQAPVDVEVLGYDLARSADLAHRVDELMKRTPGLSDVQIAREPDFPKYDIRVDRVKASLLGINERDAANAVLYSLNGNSLNPPVFTDPVSGNEYNIIVQLRPEDREHIADLGEIFLRNAGAQPASAASGLPSSLNLVTTGVSGAGTLPGGGIAPPPPPRSVEGGRAGASGQPQSDVIVPLRNIATIVPSAGPLEIDRKYLQRVTHVTANPSGRDLGSIADDLHRELAAMTIPAGFTVRLGGQIAQQQGAFSSLYFASALALVLVYMVLAAQFESLVDPFLIMFSVPLGLTGVIWALFLTGTTLSTSSFMGVIMMAGIVVSNGVLLIDYTNVLRRRGMEMREAVIAAGRTRLRPILMTTLATLVGLLPMALGLGVGSESNAPLARAVIGGLAVSTLLTLFFVPTTYEIFEEYFPRKLRPFDDDDDGAGPPAGGGSNGARV
jgi:multidrug efflux pump subunit AcrB